MRAIVPGTKAAVKPAILKEVEREYARRYQEHQDTITHDIAVQLVAAVMYTLEVNEGWGEKRLRRLMNEIAGTFEDMGGIGFASEFDTDDITEHIERKYGIDLKAEIKCKPCKAKKGITP